MSHATGHPLHLPETSVDSRRWSVLVLLCLAQFVVILDVTVVNVALPRMAADLGLDRSALTWVVTAYTLCFGGLMMLGGRLADLLGRRQMFLIGLLAFTAASLVAGLAHSGTLLVAARVAQGVGAALLSPAALSILTTTYQGPQRHRALGVWGAIGGGGAAAGVLVGGLLVSGPGWEWIFFVNVPVGVVVAALVPRMVPATPRHQGRLDVPGALLATAASGALIYGLVRAGDVGWTAGTTLLPIIMGVALYAVFAIVEHRVPAPLVQLRLFRQRPMVAGSVVMLAASGLLISGFFLNSLLLQRLLGLSALRTGLVFLPVAIATIIGAHLAGHLIGRIGPRPLAAVGFATAAVGLVLLTRVAPGGNAWTDVLPGFVLTAAGLGTGFITATVTAMSRVDPHHAGMASGTINTAHELGATLGVAIVSTIAGASIDTSAAVTGAGGFADAFWACAIAASVIAATVPWLLPPGPPPVTDGPVFVH
ncbi:DHA2 family efflux MFS transporter permease subunit [Micromonospora polyrhachis]|uniref:EmrB/QacA subfamily drug resistance transporter n=1 Tax=Micromonospora polyrhachis TaxID=1282883 RepID=A0A7W7WRY3_9ACTN|nr:MFS transporter [Micromonospora polyrhachis]MBB4960798.1 EmrB/QacA subfamily drug resistance transporter [Micromonospora polyrhachis]